MLKIKGKEIEEPAIRDSFDRRAVQLKNRIISTLKQLGIDRDNINIPMERNTRLKASASVSWYFEGRNLKYSYSLMPKFIENLYVVWKVLGNGIGDLLDEEMSLDQFLHEFSEDDDLPDQLSEARKTLNVEPEENDFDLISKNYKKLAKKYHPDMPEGNADMFKTINAAHKLIRKELT